MGEAGRSRYAELSVEREVCSQLCRSIGKEVINLAWGIWDGFTEEVTANWFTEISRHLSARAEDDLGGNLEKREDWQIPLWVGLFKSRPVSLHSRTVSCSL